MIVTEWSDPRLDTATKSHTYVETAGLAKAPYHLEFLKYRS
jgi:hypothetical protein